MKNDPVQTALAALDDLDVQSSEGRQLLAKALNARYSLVTAKAARKIGDAIILELAEPLTAAFHRLLPKPELDKGCVALTSIARALVQLDRDDSDLFRQGMKHVQKEASWGPAVDVAADLRAVCAMGLANCRDPKKLYAMAELLADREWIARAGAVKAIAVVGSEGASLLLRFKALIGDEEPDVLAETLTGLLSVDGAEALPFVSRIAQSPDRDTSEAAISALGASRRPDAIACLIDRFSLAVEPDTKKTIILALASSRTEAAINFLLDLIRTAPASLVPVVTGAMGMSEAVLAAITVRSEQKTAAH